MKDSKLPQDFVRSLLAQDGEVASETLDEHRRKILMRLEAAEKTEKSGRKTVIIACGVCLVFLLSLFLAAVGTGRIGKPPELPEWIVFTIVMSVILVPVTALLLFLVYFFRHRRDLVRIKKEAYEHTLLALPRQINELRNDLENLRGQLKDAQAEKSQSNPSQKGFTLVELLVAVVILGILASLLFPALAGAKARAHNNTCKSNLSQMGKALAMYEGDFSYLPGAGDVACKTNQAPWFLRSSDSWIVKISPYLGSLKVFACPDYRPPAPWEPGGGDKDPFGYNGGGSCEIYAHMSANLGLGFGKSNFVSSSALKVPSDMVAVGDLQLPKSVWVNIVSPQSVPIGDLLPIPKRHSGGANMLFADAHLEWARQAKWTEATAAARARWNSDHQAHPEVW